MPSELVFKAVYVAWPSFYLSPIRWVWRREWQSTPVFLPGGSQGQRSLVGYSSWGSKESDTTEQLTHTHMRWEEPEMWAGQDEPVTTECGAGTLCSLQMWPYSASPNSCLSCRGPSAALRGASSWGVGEGLAACLLPTLLLPHLTHPIPPRLCHFQGTTPLTLCSHPQLAALRLWFPKFEPIFLWVLRE